MSEMISLPVNDISAADRRSLENLLGQPLQADQQVCVMVLAAGKVPDDATRRAAVDSIRRTLEKVDRYGNESAVSDEELNEAVDEAMSHVRPRPG